MSANEVSLKTAGFSDWPDTVGSEQSGCSRAYRRHESTADWAFYYDPGFFGFGQAIEVIVLHNKQFPEIMLVEEKYLSGNAWGQTEKGEPRDPKDPYSLHWMVFRRRYWPNVERMLAAWRGETEVPKGKRKPRDIEPMTEAEITALNAALHERYITAGIPLPEEAEHETQVAVTP